MLRLSSFLAKAGSMASSLASLLLNAPQNRDGFRFFLCAAGSTPADSQACL